MNRRMLGMGVIYTEQCMRSLVGVTYYPGRTNIIHRIYGILELDQSH